MKHSLLNTIVIISLLLAGVIPARAAWDFPTSSPLAQGRWVKVRVDSTGMQRVSHEQLRRWGFSDPERVAVYGFGSVEMSLLLKANPTDLPAVAVAHYGDALYFYGEGETRYVPQGKENVTVYTNRYSTGSYYFLTDAREPTSVKVCSDVAHDDDMQPATTHLSLSFHYPREYNPSKGGAYWYSRKITAANPYTVTFPLTGYESTGRMGYRAIAKHTALASTVPVISTQEGVNFVHRAPNVIFRSTNEKEAYRPTVGTNVSTFYPAEGVEEVTFTVTPPTDTDVSLMCVEYMWTLYSRFNQMDADARPMSMYFTSDTSGEVAVKGAPADVVAWDVTDARAPMQLTVEAGTDDSAIFGLHGKDEGCSKVEVFSPSRSVVAEPAFEGEVPNTDLHAIAGGYDMVIISSPAFIPAAQRLAAAHAEYQGLNVLVASKEDVLNEFGSGSFTPNAVRIFVKMLHDRDPLMRYVLLIGDAFYDNRVAASATGPYMPCYQTESQTNAYNIAKAYTADSFFGYVEDNIEPDISTRRDNVTPRTIDVAVGRFPVSTTVEAEQLVDKTIACLKDPLLMGSPEEMMLMCDHGNENQHLMATEVMRREFHASHPGMTALRCYDAAYLKTAQSTTNTTLVKHIRAGFTSHPSVVTYAGHGGTSSLFSEAFITRNFFDNQQFGSRPLFLSASCHPYTLDYDYRGLAGDLLLLPGGGASCIIGPAREVYMKNNQEFCRELAYQYYRPEHTTIGDVYRATMSSIQESSLTVRVNALSYNLGGDPALPLPRVTGTVVLDGLEEGTMTINQGERTRLTGRLYHSDGMPWDDFDGMLEIQIYDTPLNFKSYVNVTDDAEDRVDLTLDETVIAAARCDVKGGEWEAYITVPPVANDGGQNRLTLLAHRPGSFEMASGYTTEVTLGRYDASKATADTDAPRITITIDDAMTDGERVETSRTPQITVTVDDGVTGTGINMNRGDVGGSLSVVLDGSNSFQGISRMLKPAPDGTGYTLSFTPAALTDGRHSVTAHVTDNAGNATTERLDFFVVEQGFDCSIVMESDVVTGDEVTFSLVHLLSDEPQGRMVVEDIHGGHVASIPFEGDEAKWNLKDSAGNPVATGTYVVHALVKSHPRYSATKPLKFTVIR